MKILITGGAGFIGSHLTRRLLEEEEKVVAIDNFDPFYSVTEKKNNIKGFLKNKNYKFVRGDICDKQFINDLFKEEKFDYVIHLAAKAGVRPSIANPIGYFKTNVEGTLNLLEAAKDNAIKNFVFGSSSSVYGERSKTPFSERDNVDHPISPYGLTKVVGEKLCNVYHLSYNLPVTCLRFFTVYGPGQRPDLAIRKFISLISQDKPLEMYGNGTTMRDYTYIDDIVDGITRAYRKKIDFEIINLGNSSPVKLNHLIELIASELGKRAKIKIMPCLCTT